MKDINKIEPNVMKGKEIWLSCCNCDNITIHEVLASIDEHCTEFDLDGPPIFEFFERHSIVQCKGCKNTQFLRNYKESIDIETDYEGNEYWVDHQTIFPFFIHGHRRKNGVYLLPKQIQDIYSETYSALANSQAILTGIGLRAIVEAVCKEKEAGTEDDILQKRIDILVEKGLLSREGAKFLHELRFLGNDAAHEVLPHDLTTLLEALKIAENLLDNVFFMSQKAELIKKERAKQQNQQKKSKRNCSTP